MIKSRLNLRNVATIAACLAVVTMFSGCGKDDKEPPKDPLTYDKGVVINGVKWAIRNVDKPGTFAVNKESAGMFYLWNSKVYWSTTDPAEGVAIPEWNNSWNGGYETPSIDDVWQTANDPCPQGWRVPIFAPNDIIRLFMMCIPICLL